MRASWSRSSGLYRRFDWPLSQTAVAEMNAWLSRQKERRRPEVRHRYRLEDHGLTPGEVDAAFAPYREFTEALEIQGLGAHAGSTTGG